MLLKEEFGPYVSSKYMDRDVSCLIKETKDPRWVRWHNPDTIMAGLFATTVLA